MKIDLKVPVQWNEMTTAQLEYYSQLFLKQCSEIEIMTRCFLHFSGLKLIKKDPVLVDGEQCHIFKHKGSPRFMLEVDRVADAVERMRYLVKDVSLFRLPEKMKLSAGIRETSYHPVDWRLYSVSLEEYILLDQYYLEFTRSRNIDMIDRMMAIVYRKPGEAWDLKTIEQRVRRFRRMPAFRKYVVYLWYTGLKMWFINKYYFVFSQGGEGADQAADEVVMGLISAMNEGDITKNKQILGTDVHEVLYELNRKIEQSQKI